MTLPDDDAFDPDDNFATGEDEFDIDDAAGAEALVWQLLLVINPGDEDAARQQFGEFQEALDGGSADDADIARLLANVTDWKSGFTVEETDTGALVDAIAELSARFGLAIDWGVEDPTDAEFLASASTSELLQTARDQLRLDGYTLWSRDTGTETLAGWMTLASDDEAMRVLSHALGMEVRPAGR